MEFLGGFIVIRYEGFSSRSAYRCRNRLRAQGFLDAEVIGQGTPAFRECLLDADRRGILLKKGTAFIVRWDTEIRQKPLNLGDKIKEENVQQSKRGGRREGAGRKGIADGQTRKKVSIHCSRREEVLCHGLLSLLRGGVPLERIDGIQIRRAADKYHSEYIERLERKNARTQKRIDAMKQEMRELETD